jgi:predicted O-linked N-acetylglucosamine transferase (SPINDLY family)
MNQSDPRKVILHLGCGHARLPDNFAPALWREIRLDIDASVKPDVVSGMTDMPQISNSTIDAIWSSHNLEHLHAHEVALALAEFYRVLKPGGMAYAAMPDVQSVAIEIAKGHLEEALYQSPAGPISSLDVLWGHAASIRAGNAYMAHKTGFTAKTIEHKFKAAGFCNVRVERNISAFELFVSAQKPIPLESIEHLFEQGRQCHIQQRWMEAERFYRQVIALQNSHWPAWHELGVVSYAQDKIDEAIACAKQSISLQPRHALAYLALGIFLGVAGRPQEAAECLKHYLSLEPYSAEGHYNLGKAWQDLKAFILAEQEYRQAIAINPDYALAHLNLGNVLTKLGCFDEVLRHYLIAAEIIPEPWLFSNVCMFMAYQVGYSNSQVFATLQDFNQRYIAPLASSITAFQNNKNPDRRIKIGYVSRDLREHSVRYFITPILSCHDHNHCEIYCYYSHDATDESTHLLRKHADHWVECSKMSNADLAKRIRDDAIDILIDLEGHTDRNRLLVFACKPAPVQATYLGYPSTTGLSVIDYRISDCYLDPDPPDPEIVSSEIPLRLKHGYYCYAPLPNSPDVSSLPAESNHYITFGSLNQQHKLNRELFILWADILRGIPNAKLFFQNSSTHLPEVRNRLITEFEKLDIDGKRLFFGVFEKAPAYLQSYHEIDIALDSFPGNGGTTTCEALWMGVPVISLSAKRHVSRLGLSILSQIGLPELAAEKPQHYIDTAVSLAQNIAELKKMRATMRERMMNSPLMDSEGFTQELEAVYRAIWRNWCQRRDF